MAAVNLRSFDPRPRLRAVAEDVREFYLLRDAERRADALDADKRGKLGHDVRLAAQRREAADVLWQHGARAQALRMMRDAYELLLRNAGQDAATDAQLAAPFPDLEDDVRPADEERFYELGREYAILERDLSVVAMPSRDRRQRTLQRIATTVLVVGALGAVFVWWMRRTELVPDASASYSPKFGPANAVDNNETTHWVLPDRTPGYFETKLVPPRKVTAVAILNGWDPAAYGIVEYRLEGWSGDHIVKRLEGKFEPAPAGVKPPWVEIPFESDRKLDKVRVVVKTYKDLGGSIAEFTVKTR